MKKFILPIFLLFLFLFVPLKVQAATIFQDNFDNGANGWTPLSGSNLWTVNQGKYGAHIDSFSTIIRTHADFIIPTSNYTIDFDMYTVSGTDKNITFRLNDDSTTGYEIHFSGDAVNGFGKVVQYTALQNFNLSENHPYHIKIVLDGQHMQFFVNGDKLFDEVDPNYHFAGHERLGFMMGTGAVAPTEIWFDNVVISTSDSSTSLNVPLLKQADPLWRDEIYDSAPSWQTSGGVSIGRIGCALTSAAMVFRYFGLTKMQDGITELNPKSMNNWLNSIGGSSFRNGNTNWEALAAHSSELKIANSVPFDVLEYKETSPQNDTVVKDYIANGIPGILDVQGHFVVATGVDSINNSFTINDPFYDRTSLVSYNNYYKKIGIFTPGNSDVSYLVFVVNPNVQLVLKDGNNQIIGETYIQDPISDPFLTSVNLVGPLKIVSFPKPSTGNYTVEVSSTNPSPYYLQGYLYDINGNVSMVDEKDVLSQNDTDIFHFYFNKNGNQNLVLSQEVTFATLRNDVKALCSLGYLKKEFCKEIMEKINEIDKKHEKERDEERGEDHDNSITKKLNELMKEIRKEKKVNSYASTILVSDIQALIDSLSQVSTSGS